jgi:hypothetical protein
VSLTSAIGHYRCRRYPPRVSGHSGHGGHCGGPGRILKVEAQTELAEILDQYYVATRYPNGLPGGTPFEAFGERQAREAIAAAERFLALAAGAAPAA